MADGDATTGPAPAGWIDSGVKFEGGDASQKYGDGWGGYLGDVMVTEFGLLPVPNKTGSASTKYCDYIWSRPGWNRVALFGGNATAGSDCGALACCLRLCLSNSNWYLGASPSSKPEVS